MDSRSLILNKVKSALSDVDKSRLQPPEMPEIWSFEGRSREELSSIFAENLKSVAGQPVLCENRRQAIEKLEATMKEVAETSRRKRPFQMGVYDSTLTLEIAGELANICDDWVMLNEPDDPAVDPKVYEPITASLVSPFALLADTGSCVVEGRSAFSRFLLYLAPACFMLAKASQLRENLPHAWSEIETKMQNPSQRGEVAIVTGPSRTADIEKKLVLGVHGPQKLVVFLIQDE